MTATNPMARVRVENHRVYLLDPEQPVSVVEARALLRAAESALMQKRAKAMRDTCPHVVEIPGGHWLAARGTTNRRGSALVYSSRRSAETAISKRERHGSLSPQDAELARLIPVRLMEVP